MSDDEKIRLGGMALPNGVLVHGPTSWACAIRAEDGTIEVASALKRFRASTVSQPVPARPGAARGGARAAAAGEAGAAGGEAADAEPARSSRR